MPALFFPNLDTLRLVLASGIVPPGVAGTPGRAVVDPHGRVWLEPGGPLSREDLAALARVGVRAAGDAGVPTEQVGCWAELLPLRPAGPGADRPSGLVLFELPNARLAGFAAELRRLSGAPVGVRLLSGEGPARGWVTAPAPPLAVLLRCQEPGSPVEPFAEQAPGVWVRLGWEHPTADRLAVPPGRVLLLRPPRDFAVHTDPVPDPAFEEYPLPRRPAARSRPSRPPVIPVRLTLAPKREADRDELWVFPGGTAEQFWEFCGSANERLVGQFEAAAVSAGGQTRVVVRAAAGTRSPQPLPPPAVGYAADPRVPGLFVPAGSAIRPPIRAKELARLFDLGPGRVTWVEPGPNGVSVSAVPISAFRRLRDLVEYVPPSGVRLATHETGGEPFPFARFTLREEPTPGAGGPDPDAPPGDASGPDDRSGWLARSLVRIASRLRRGDQPAGRETAEDPAPTPAPPPRPRRKAGTPAAGRVEQKLSSADALLHGHDRAARRYELEARLLAEFPLLGPDERVARWAELAALYGATGKPTDAAVCWVNAAWECDPPPPPWLEQWFLAECRAARQGGPGLTLDRWLSEPGRPGAGRVVAAYAAWAGHRSPPPADLLAALPRVLAFLDQHFDDLPARAAWLARLAVTRLCDGDALGLARWRDRVLARLREKGPGLDLDEPSFLRFHGTASPDRFGAAKVWLADARKPIVDWVGRLNSGGRLQWAGLDAETDCTAAYAQLMLGWGLGYLGERMRSRDWAARARKVLARAGGPGVDPAVHAVLADLFLDRIRDAQEMRRSRPGLPPELLARYDQLPAYSRYAVDRLRKHSRILEPAGRVQAFLGLDLREFRGQDRLGERLHVLADRADPADLTNEARELLTACAADPSPATVPRVVLTLLDVAPHVDRSVAPVLLGQGVPAVAWLEAWLQAGRWTEAERAELVPVYLARLLDGAFAAAVWFDQWPAARPLVEYLTRRAGGDAALRAGLARAAGSVFRSLRKLGYRSEAEALLQVLDPGGGDLPPGAPFPATRPGLAVGWFAVGDEDAGNRILNDARDRLFLAGPADGRDLTALAVAYADALGFAPPRIALGRLAEIFQRLDPAAVRRSGNQYYTPKPLELIDAVVRSVVTEDFALGPAVRGWLDDDEFLIRRRIHRDMAAVMRDEGLG